MKPFDMLTHRYPRTVRDAFRDARYACALECPKHHTGRDLWKGVWLAIFIGIAAVVIPVYL